MAEQSSGELNGVPSCAAGAYNYSPLLTLLQSAHTHSSSHQLAFSLLEHSIRAGVCTCSERAAKMVAGSIADECTLAVPADRLWKAAFAEDLSIYPKACAGFIDSVELEGDNVAPGSITIMKLNAALGGAKEMRSRLVARDTAARVIKTEVLVEGGEVSSQFKLQTTEVKLEAAGDNACMVKLRVDYETHDGGALSLEDGAKVTQGYFSLLKQVEAYLIAHPTEYA